MLCSTCYGQHWVIRAGQPIPCPECGGLGEIHCCDGLIAQSACAERLAGEVPRHVESTKLSQRSFDRES